MKIKFHSTVIMTEDFELMKSYYQNMRRQYDENLNSILEQFKDDTTDKERT